MGGLNRHEGERVLGINSEVQLPIPLGVFRDILPKQLKPHERIIRIDKAVDKAPAIYLDELDPGTPNPLERFRNAADNDIVEFNTDIIPEENSVYVRTVEELRDLWKTVYQIYGDGQPPNEQVLNDQVTHERAHVLGATNYGSDSIYGISVRKIYQRRGDNNYELRWNSFTRTAYKGPKLGLAAHFAHPADLSGNEVVDTADGDLLRIRALGYRDVHDVGQRIEAWNKTYENKIPLPQSYKSDK